MRLLVPASALALALSVAPIALRYGPDAEALLAPVIEWQAVGTAQTKPSVEMPGCNEDGPCPAFGRPLEVKEVRARRDSPEDYSSDGERVDRLLFKMDAVKYRPCENRLVSWRWFFDHQAEPAIVFYDDNKGEAGEDEQFYFGTSTLYGPLITRPLRADIPQVAYSFREVWLVGNFFYACHGGWLVPEDIRIKVSIPGPRSEEQPEAEPDREAFFGRLIRTSRSY